MFGTLTAGKKAAEFGYKRYGLPGAVVAGTAGAAGAAIGMKKLKAAVTESEDASNE